MTPDSVVWDVGGYKGEWAEKIIEKYDPYIYIFEPIPDFYKEIKRKFSDNNKVTVIGAALSDKSGEQVMSNEANSSSLHSIGSKDMVNIELLDIKEFYSNQNFERKKIDLVKINIEGEEYALLERIINSGLIDRLNNLQIQFHYKIEDAEQKRRNIHQKLKKSHYLTYNYPFIWENWKKSS